MQDFGMHGKMDDPKNESDNKAIREQIDALYRAESRHIFAALVRLVGDFDLAEDALHDAFRAAMEQWPRDGLTANPRAWRRGCRRRNAARSR
jgi:RNA polymerase sigma-70 factor, ECF subfamily